MEENAVVKSLAALAQPMRLRVFRSLVVAGPAGQTPGQLAEQLQVAGATLSFHLKELVHAGLITQQRDGRSLICRADFSQMNGLLDYLTRHCCEGETCELVDAGCSNC
ncbi:MAG: helix-turn-helix domain-containing protein [Ramlibacter sp.]